MTKIKIGITGWGSISALGSSAAQVWNAYQDPHSKIRLLPDQSAWGAFLYPAEEALVRQLQESDRHFLSLDRSVLLALVASEQAQVGAGWEKGADAGVNIGSSRGATHLLEKYFQRFLDHEYQQAPVLTSPTTTLGNIASWVAYRLRTAGPAISHSITCSSALHALINGVSWLESGRLSRFVAGGSEAPLTPFTIAQMKALRIYAGPQETDYPCRALAPDLQANTLVLGEGAASFCLEANPQRPLAWIGGIGYASEKMETATGVNPEGAALQQAMRMALAEANRKTVDIVVCHAPGTRLGDQAERRAIGKVFGENIPFLTTNKWKIGHTLGASGALSLEMALLMLLHNQSVGIPYLAEGQCLPGQVNTVLINALGFGGNAVSILLTNSL